MAERSFVEEVKKLRLVAGETFRGEGILAEYGIRFENSASEATAASTLAASINFYLLARLRRWRRSTLRYAIEDARIQQWLRRIAAAAAFNPQLALEMMLCHTLVKGYGDTHAHGWRNFETIMAIAESSGKAPAPSMLRELREAALADESGLRLRSLIERQGASIQLRAAMA